MFPTQQSPVLIPIPILIGFAEEASPPDVKQPSAIGARKAIEADRGNQPREEQPNENKNSDAEVDLQPTCGKLGGHDAQRAQVTKQNLDVERSASQSYLDRLWRLLIRIPATLGAGGFNLGSRRSTPWARV